MPSRIWISYSDSLGSSEVAFTGAAEDEDDDDDDDDVDDEEEFVLPCPALGTGGLRPSPASEAEADLRVGLRLPPCRIVGCTGLFFSRSLFASAV